MSRFPQDILNAIAIEPEVQLMTYGRKTGKESTVTVWIVTDGDKVYIRSGKGMQRHWPKNLLARPEGKLHIEGRVVPFESRHITNPTEARHSSTLYYPKYGPSPVKPSSAGDVLTAGEQAAFELLPLDTLDEGGRIQVDSVTRP